MEKLFDKLEELESEGKDDEALSVVEDEIQPAVEDVRSRFESVDPTHEKVKKLNDMQIESEEFAKDKNKQLIGYYEDGDVSKVDIHLGAEEIVDEY